MAVEDEIRQASEQFYTALNRAINGDPGPIEEVWSHGSANRVGDPGVDLPLAIFGEFYSMHSGE